MPKVEIEKALAPGQEIRGSFAPQAERGLTDKKEIKPLIRRTTTGRGGERLAALDGLRGVAALFVAIYHNQQFFGQFGFFSWAWINVDLFFLISGIVLMHVYEVRILSGTVDFPIFLAHRVARLWPLHLFALFFFLFVRILLHLTRGGEDDSMAVYGDSAVYTFFLNLFFIQNVGLYQQPSWYGACWSLSPEIFLNLVWFYLIAKGKLSSKLIVLTVFTCAVIQYNVTGTVSDLVFGSRIVRCAISFGLGCLIYRHLINNPRLGTPPLPWSNSISFGSVLLLIAIIISVATGRMGRILHHWDWICILFIFPTIVYFALQEKTWLNLLFSSRPLVFLGYISYAVYLLHLQISLLVFHGYHILVGPHAAIPLLGFFYLVVTCGISYLAYVLIENPCRRLLRPKCEGFFRKIFFDGPISIPASPVVFSK